MRKSGRLASSLEREDLGGVLPVDDQRHSEEGEIPEHVVQTGTVESPSPAVAAFDNRADGQELDPLRSGAGDRQFGVEGDEERGHGGQHAPEDGRSERGQMSGDHEDELNF